MAITAQAIIRQVLRDLNDVAAVRWTLADVVSYLNDAQRDIVLQRPDAGNVAATIKLQSGSKQALPVGCTKLIDVLHNAIGARRAVTRVDRKLLDAQCPGWRGLQGAQEIQHFCYDEREPRAFDVYPPAALGAALAVEYAALPTDIQAPGVGQGLNDITGTLGLPDIYANAVRNYMMFRAYSRQAEYASNPGAATAFYNLYRADLGMEAQATAAVSPNNTPP